FADPLIQFDPVDSTRQHELQDTYGGDLVAHPYLAHVARQACRAPDRVALTAGAIDRDQRSKGELRSRNSSRQASLKSRSGSISPLSLIFRSSGNVLFGSK